MRGTLIIGSIEPMNILILGGTGRVGSHLLAELADSEEQGHARVFAASRRGRTGAGRDERLPTWVDARHLDLEDLSTYAPALEGIDRLFLVTGYTVAMLEQSKNLIDAAKAAGISHVVHVGTFHPPGGPSSRLVRHFVWHQLVETYIEASGLSFTHLNPNAFMQNFVGAMTAGALRMFFAGQRVGLVDCRDVARVAARALLDPTRHAGRRYFLSAEALTMDEAAVVLSEELRRPVHYQPLSPQDVSQLPIAGLMERTYFECIVNIAERMQRGELPDFAWTTRDIEEVTGGPATSFRAFVRREKEAFVE